jgi:hypothetical protein
VTSICLNFELVVVFRPSSQESRVTEAVSKN